MRTQFRVCFFVLVTLSAPAVAGAEAIVVGGGTVASPNCIPFGCPLTGFYQQFYMGSALGPSPITITQIGFASEFAFGPFPVHATYDLSLALSRTTRTAPISSYEGNRGADYTTVFAGPFSTTLVGDGTFDLAIPLSTPFVFDPRRGNLVLEVHMNSATLDATGDPPNVYFATNFNEGVSRIFGSDAFVHGDFGLDTAFTTTGQAPVPEPASILLLGAAAAGLFARTRRRREQPTA